MPANTTPSYTFDQIVNTDCAGLDGRATSPGQRSWIAKPIICKDGTTLSVQASYGHYCQPRGNEAPYSAVEVGYPSAQPDAEWMQYEDGEGSSVYGYVPVEMVRAFIEAHGGEAPQVA